MQTQRSPRSASTRTSKSPPPPEERFVPVSSVKMPPKSHRPSLSGSMNWLGRSSTSSSSSTGSYAPSKPIRISEPFIASAFDRLTRTGQLGAGATVVRTPQEALSIKVPPRTPEQRSSILEEDEEEDPYTQRLTSPPLPPLPEDDVDDDATLIPNSNAPSCPTRPPPSVPSEEEEPVSPRAGPKRKRRPSLKVLDEFPPVPSLPANLPPSPPQAPFEPILLSPVPAGAIDPSKILVSIETSTATYKTTLKTLTSRPSFLATYLQSLLPSHNAEEDEPQSSIPSADSFQSIFHKHLASSGLLSPSTTSIHIFLDRPSAPYAHIFTYLRTPLSTPEHPAALPRAVQLLSSSSSRLEALLELRDEARYLDLEELYKLCTDELRARHNLAVSRVSMHSRGMSSNSISTGSGRSVGLGTLRENLQENDHAADCIDDKAAKRLSRDSGVGSSNGSSSSFRDSVVPEIGWHPAQVSAGLAQRAQSRPRKASSVRGRPTGEWI